MSSPIITREFIQEGIIRAFHSSRLFLKDAIFLYESGRLASAYIMGVIAIEQLGRANWMHIQQADMVAKNLTTIEGEAFSKQLRNVRHHETIRHGTMSVTMNSPVNEEFIEIMQTQPPTSPEFQAASKAYRQFYADQFTDKVTTTHELRMQIQYVNPMDDCSGWTSPFQIKPERVREMLRGVGTDNRVMYMVLEPQTELMDIAKKLGVYDELASWQATWLTDDWNDGVRQKEESYKQKAAQQRP